MIKVGTHSFTFHSDEIIAIALIGYTDDIEITRSRSEIVLGECELLIDVGEEYVPKEGKYDHHQFQPCNPFYGLSSAGLVYKDVRDHMKTIGDLTDLDAFIEAVDARDTRSGYDVSNVYEPVFDAITALNHITPSNHEEQMRMFEVLVANVTVIIDALLEEDSSKYGKMVGILEVAARANTKSKAVVFQQRAKAFQVLDEVVVSEFFPEWRPLSRTLGKCFIIPGDIEGQYKVMTDTSKTKIVALKDQVFVHPNGFIGVCEPTKDSTHIGIALLTGELFEVSLADIENAFTEIRKVTDSE